MKISEFIKTYSSFKNCAKIKQLEMWWCKSCREDDSWKDMNVNFYTLLCNCPLWKFNYLYNKWYKVRSSKHEGGPMGDFLEDEPTDKQIEDYMFGEDIIF